MSDIDIERLREAVEDAPNLYDNAGDIATLVRAARFLVSLADAGFEVYRPEDVETFRLCLAHVAEADDDETCDWYWDEDGSRCDVGTYRLVPVEGEN